MGQSGHGIVFVGISVKEIPAEDLPQCTDGASVG